MRGPSQTAAPIAAVIVGNAALGTLRVDCAVSRLAKTRTDTQKQRVDRCMACR